LPAALAPLARRRSRPRMTKASPMRGLRTMGAAGFEPATSRVWSAMKTKATSRQARAGCS